MGALLSDTLRLARTLREKGRFTPEQAEALSEASQSDLATKADLAAVRTEIAELRAELKSEMGELRTGLRTDMAAVPTGMAEMRAELLKWFIGAIGVQTIVILGALLASVRLSAKQTRPRAISPMAAGARELAHRLRRNFDAGISGA